MPLGRRDRWNGKERRVVATVLVAGDERGPAELLLRLLHAQGYRTVRAETHEEATARTTEQLPRAAVIDLAGGTGSTLQLLDWFRSHDDERIARCRVIVIGTSAATRNFSFQSGADEFLIRPFHARELLDALKVVLATPYDQLRERRRRRIVEAPT